MAATTQLNLPYIEAAQAQKHVTHNDALRILDALVMLAALDRDLASPPSSPADGDRYLVASGASGAWTGKDGKIAAWQDGAWAFFAPQEGWHLWVADEDILLVFDGASWVGVSTQNAALIGVGTTADATNKLAVSSPAVLFNHAGDSVQMKLNKNGDGDTASMLFQKSFSGRAEIGLVGDNNLAFKTSPDGSSFAVGLSFVAAASGVPKLPSFTVAGLPSAATAGAGALAHVSNETDGAVLAFSDGAAWRRVTDRAIVA
jgi:hypothetical protein